MKGLLLMAALAAAVFVWPPLAEGGNGPCDAFEKRAIKTGLMAGMKGFDLPKGWHGFGQWLGQVAQRFSGGQVAQTVVAGLYPNAPLFLACTGVYWWAVVDPDGLHKAIINIR